MKLEIAKRVPAPIAIEEFIEIANELYNPCNPASAWDMRWPLLALAQNRETIFELICKSIEARLNENLQTEQASYYVLYNEEHFSLRATVWMPELDTSELSIIQGSTFAYDFPHNHDFDLITVNCFGPGYETDIYEINPLGRHAKVGDCVDAYYTGRTQLAPGAMLSYEAFKDVHIQVPTEEISMALNFLPRSEMHRGRTQHAFDVLSNNRLRINGILLSEESRELWVARLLAKLSFAGYDVENGLRRIYSDRASSSVGQFVRSILRDHDHAKVFRQVTDSLRKDSSMNVRAISDSNRARRLSNISPVQTS